MTSIKDKGLKLSYSKSLFCEKTTEVRTLQNDLIGTIKENGIADFVVQNVQNNFIQVCTYTDAKIFILNSYINLGRPGEKSLEWQLKLF
jgi:hypothetical protein